MAKKDGALILVGTQKGGYIFWSGGARKKWSVTGPHFRGAPVYHMAFDTRDGRTLWAATNSTWGGPKVERSRDLGKTWKTMPNPAFWPDSGLTLKRVWHIEPGLAGTNVTYVGLEPAALFRWTEEGEESVWTPVTGLNDHPTRAKWEPGGGGLALHSIAIDAGDPSRIAIGISSGGAYLSISTRRKGAPLPKWS